MHVRVWLLVLLVIVGAGCGDATTGQRDSEAPQSSARDSQSEGFLSAPGGRVWYRVVNGPESAPPLLILHGGPGAGSRYCESLSNLSSDRSVVFYDQLGAGRSDHPDDDSLWTIERHIAELDAVRAQLGLTRVHLLGHSWGAMLLMDYLLTNPSGVVSATFASPVVSVAKWEEDTRQRITELPPEVQTAIVANEEAGTFDNPEYQAAMMAFYHHYVSRTDPWPDSVNLTFAEFGNEVYGYMWGPSEFTVTGTLKDWEREGELGRISVPTLFMVGEFDETLPATVKGFADQVAGSRFAVIPGSAHLTFVDAPQRSAEVVGRFLASVDQVREGQ